MPGRATSTDLPILPFYLPATMTDEAFLFRREVKLSTHIGFRRVYFRRRLLTGEYETDWQLIDERRVMKYGSAQTSVDAVKLNFFDQGGVTVQVDNSDGYFAAEDYRSSFWNGYMSQYRTLCKVVAGYDVGLETVIEVPSQTTLFYGILTDETEQARNNTVSFKFKGLASVFSEVTADRLSFTSISTLTAYNLLTCVRDYTDSNGVAYFQKFFSLGAWDLSGASNQGYTLITTTVLNGSSVLDFIKKLAAAERAVFYVGPDGGFKFVSRTGTNSSTAHFFGGALFTSDQAHTIIDVTKYGDATAKVYNRVRVKFGQAETETSYYTAQETWAWGDSSSSFKFGVKTLDLDIPWMSTAAATTIGDAMLNEYQYPKKEITFRSKFYPPLNILDRITVSYAVIDEESSLWGTALIGRDTWASSNLQHNEFRAQEFYITRLVHNVDDFTTEISGRAV